MENKQQTHGSLLTYNVWDWEKDNHPGWYNTPAAQSPEYSAATGTESVEHRDTLVDTATHDNVELTAHEVYAFSGIEAIEVMRELRIDEAVGKAAETIERIMTEFAADDEVFQPSIDAELMQFLRDVLQREHPTLSVQDREWLLDQVLDFPPVR